MSAIHNLLVETEQHERETADAEQAHREHEMQKHMEHVSELLGANVVAELRAESEWT